MNCEWVKTNGSLYLYNELPDDARHELDQHLTKCPACAAEIASLKQLHGAMDTLAMSEPSANLLAASRMKLQEALETAEQKKSWGFVLDAAGWFHQVRFAPALAAVLLMCGFAGGILTTLSMARPSSATGVVPVAADLASIAAIRGITQTTDPNRVEIKYDKLVPDTANGSLDDPRIQQLLLYAAHSNYNSGVRMDSIDLLTQKPQDSNIREALIFALRYDKNPGVRLKALAGLRSFVKDDVRVRDVMLEALLRDTNSGVRTEAIRALEPVIADSSVRLTLSELAVKDPNKFIKDESRRVLAALPEIQ